MDCERFEAALIDELYDELDELTSAATKRHAAGCARCASLLGGLRATRRVATLPFIEPSMDLEDRILAAARNAQKVVPIGRKVSSAISWAGSWAMRPQTAMAAVFVLMIGSSLLFVRRRKVADNATVTVTAQGAPAAPAPAALDESPPLDSKVAAAAHGAGPAGSYAPPAAPNAAPSAAPWEGLAGLGKDDLKAGASGGALGRHNEADDEGLSASQSRSDAIKGQGLTSPPPPAAPAQAVAGGSTRPAIDKSQAAGSGPQAPLDEAKALYAARDFPSATAAFDSIAAGGDLDAALWAARSVREGNGGCALAKDRFDQVAARAWGTTTGYQATLEAGRCYRTLGATDVAQAHYSKLLTVQQFAPLAQMEINAMSQVASRAATKKPVPAKSAAPASGAAVIASPTAQQGRTDVPTSQQKMPSQQKAAQ
jgi:hypothetical protein